MSCNITIWKVKKLENLIIPVASLYKHEREDWHPSRHNNDDGTVEFGLTDGEGIKGILHKGLEYDYLEVTDIECCGEGSGTSMSWILQPALEDSTGQLVVSCIWEGESCIHRLIVDDGDVKWEVIEI